MAHNLSAAYRQANQLENAENVLRECLEIRRRKRPDEWWTFAVESLLGAVLREQNEFVEAEALLIEGHEGLQARMDTIPPIERFRLTMSIEFIVKLYEAWEKPDEAEKWATKLEDSYRETIAALPADSTERAGRLAEFGSRLLESKRYVAAGPLLRECLTIREKKLPDDWVLFNTKSMLGGALAGQKKFQEAEPLLVEGYSGMKEREARIPPAAQPRVTEALQRLVDLYDAWEKKDKADEWRKMLEESKAAASPSKSKK